MNKRTLIGVLTPSSNTVLEPITSAMLGDLDDVSAHFGRFRVTEISTSNKSISQFCLDAQLAAAKLLADAQVHSIVWSGTSASWLGFEKDQAMCTAIEEHTGTVAGSAVLAINQLFDECGAKTFGLVSPYTSSIQQLIVENYAGSGRQCVAEEHFDETDNYAFSEFSEDVIEKAIRDVAKHNPDAITIMCTNMRGAKLAASLESELNIPIFDSTSAAVWSGLRLAGSDASQIKNWGRMFSY